MRQYALRAFACLLSLVFGTVVFGQHVAPGVEIDISIDLMERPIKAGPAKLSVSLSTDKPFGGTVRVMIMRWGNMLIEGDTVRTLDLSGKSEHAFLLNVNIADNDTVAIQISVFDEGRRVLGYGQCRFVTTSDILEFSHAGPPRSPEIPLRRQKLDPGTRASDVGVAQGMDTEEPCFRTILECQKCSSESTEIELLLKISERRWCGEVEISLSGSEGVVFKGETLWRDTLRNNSEITRLIKVILPGSDTSYVNCNVQATHFEINVSPPVPLPGGWRVAFVTGADSLEFHKSIRTLRLLGEKQKKEIFREARDVFDKSGADFVLSQVNYVSKELNSARLEQFTQLRASRFGDEVSVTLKPFNSVEIAVETSWTEYFESVSDADLVFRRPQHTRWYDVTFPGNDTSGIEMTFTCGDRQKQTQITFVTTGDTVEIWLGPPMVGMPMQWSPRTDASLIEKYPYLFGDQAKTRGYTITPDDSTKARLRLEDTKRKDMARLADLEQHPCTNLGQTVVVGDELWERRKGEYKFHLAGDPAYDEVAVLDMIVKLNNPDDHEFVRGLVSNLRSTDEPGHYRADVSTDVFSQLRDREIVFYRYKDPALAPKGVSLSEIPEGAKGGYFIHLVADLRKPADLEFFKDIARDVQPMEREDYYHGMVRPGDVATIRARGMRVAKHPRYPDED